MVIMDWENNNYGIMDCLVNQKPDRRVRISLEVEPFTRRRIRNKLFLAYTQPWNKWMSSVSSLKVAFSPTPLSGGSVIIGDQFCKKLLCYIFVTERSVAAPWWHRWSTPAFGKSFFISDRHKITEFGAWVRVFWPGIHHIRHSQERHQIPTSIH